MMHLEAKPGSAFSPSPIAPGGMNNIPLHMQFQRGQEGQHLPSSASPTKNPAAMQGAAGSNGASANHALVTPYLQSYGVSSVKELPTALQPASEDSLKAAQEKAVGLRRGKWTPEEEAYANRVIQEFKLGLLPLSEGTTLRTFLSKLLNCDPMRISKKYVGAQCIGKQVFRRRQLDSKEIQANLERSRRELAELEHLFLNRVSQPSKKRKKKRKDGTQKPPDPPALSLQQAAALLTQQQQNVNGPPPTSRVQSNPQASIAAGPKGYPYGMPPVHQQPSQVAPQQMKWVNGAAQATLGPGGANVVSQPLQTSGPRLVGQGLHSLQHGLPMAPRGNQENTLPSEQRDAATMSRVESLLGLSKSLVNNLSYPDYGSGQAASGSINRTASVEAFLKIMQDENQRQQAAGQHNGSSFGGSAGMQSSGLSSSSTMPQKMSRVPSISDLTEDPNFQGQKSQMPERRIPRIPSLSELTGEEGSGGQGLSGLSRGGRIPRIPSLSELTSQASEASSGSHSGSSVRRVPSISDLTASDGGMPRIPSITELSKTHSLADFSSLSRVASLSDFARSGNQSELTSVPSISDFLKIPSMSDLTSYGNNDIGIPNVRSFSDLLKPGTSAGMGEARSSSGPGGIPRVPSISDILPSSTSLGANTVNSTGLAGPPLSLRVKEAAGVGMGPRTAMDMSKMSRVSSIDDIRSLVESGTMTAVDAEAFRHSIQSQLPVSFIADLKRPKIEPSAGGPALKKSKF